MTLTSSLRFLYIFDRSGLLCAMPLSLKNLLLSFLKKSDVISSVETFLVVKRMGIVIGKVDGFGMFFYVRFVLWFRTSKANF